MANADKISAVAYVKKLLAGSQVYARRDRARKKHILEPIDGKEQWFFKWSEVTGEKATVIGIIVKSQLQSWCAARTSEGCHFFSE